MGLTSSSLGVKIFNTVVTFLLVSLAWMIFRANSLSDLGALLYELFCGWGGVSITASLEALSLPLIRIFTIILAVIVLKELDKQINTRPNLDRSSEPLSLARSSVYLVITWAVAVAWMMLLASNTESSFIYFQF